MGQCAGAGAFTGLDPADKLRHAGTLKSRLNEKRSQQLAGMLLFKFRAKIGPTNEIAPTALHIIQANPCACAIFRSAQGIAEDVCITGLDFGFSEV